MAARTAPSQGVQALWPWGFVVELTKRARCGIKGYGEKRCPACGVQARDLTITAVRNPLKPARALRQVRPVGVVVVLFVGQKPPQARKGIKTDSGFASMSGKSISQKPPQARKGIKT